MKTIINNHTENILGTKPSISTLTCNCQNKEASPISGQYRIGEVVYEGTLSSNQPNYKENEEESVKECLHNHNLSFRSEIYKSDTELSKELWQIKMKNCTW